MKFRMLFVPKLPPAPHNPKWQNLRGTDRVCVYAATSDVHGI